MQIVAIDLLTEARELSVGLTITAWGLGFLLWVLGWRGHRFWTVFVGTVVGGLVGLSIPPQAGVQPLVAGLLAAVAAGVLALALVRVLAFLGVGFVACLVVRAVAPNTEQFLIPALVGGLLGVLLFRFWMMALTSMSGALISLYAILGLLDRLVEFDAVDWAKGNMSFLNGTWVVLSVLGLLIQFLLERRGSSASSKKDKGAKDSDSEKGDQEENTSLIRLGWVRGSSRPRRKAG